MNAKITYTTAVKTALRWGCATVALALVTACATGPNANPADPLEPFNRGVYRFNDAVDTAVLVPVATAYNRVLPSPVRTGVHNFFSNLTEVWSFVNSVLQLRAQDSAETFMRFNVNTLFGLGGILDVATELGIDRHQEDFGQTLGYWGVGSGPFVMLPLLGPSTLRDTVALPVDVQGGLLSEINDVGVRNSLYVLRIVDARARYLRATSLIGDAALDKYSFTRDAYLQRRAAEVNNGKPSQDGGDY
ncbi:MAG: VacJ family lipoprotein [Pseudomonadota bacterium]